MVKVVVPLNAYSSKSFTKEEQESFISIVANSGANGVEVRRELLPNKEFSLTNLRKYIAQYKLTVVYSAPIPIWKEDKSINKEEIILILKEAKELGAKMVKFSLGYFEQCSHHLEELKSLLIEHLGNLKFLIENDQTLYGGNINRLVRFFESAYSYGVPVHMTFDIGNWKYTNENVDEAFGVLQKYIAYVHLKHVESRNDELVTVPLSHEEDAKWRGFVHKLSSHIPMALEFPLLNPNMTRDYIALAKEEIKMGELKCLNLM